MSRDRYLRARLAGAGTLDRKGWDSVVASAEAIERLRWPSFAEVDAAGPAPRPAVPEHVWLGRGQMVIDARTVLEVEAELALAEAFDHELRALAAADMDALRRARILRMADDLRKRIAKRGEPS